MKNKSFSIIPIGGVQEIGSNMTLIRTGTEDIVIDCGLLFPYEECFDINYLIPDFSFLAKNKFTSIVITHGHEDHIGGLGHLLRAFPEIIVYVNQFTLHLIQKKLEEFQVKLNYRLFDDESEISFKEIDISVVHVNHSIPETTGLIVRDKSKDWGALYISDFKVDLKSKHEKPIDLPRIKSLLSQCKKTAYFIDSTNILNQGKTESENVLHNDLHELINRENQRVFITLFASNIHRLDLIANMAKAANRKIVIMGRSLKTYLEAAIETGHTTIKSDEVSLPDQVKGEKGRMLIFLSGCQGDFLSALRRFSFGEDSTFKPNSSDLIIFSSKVIPGNEKKIYRIYNKLSESGMEIATASDHLIHSSGHPGQEDLKILLDSFAPDFYIPIHGESYFLKKHFDFIKQTYPQITPYLIYNYHEVIFGDSKLTIEKHDVVDPRLIHGKNLEIEKTQISQRRKMATQGAVFVSFNKHRNLIEITNIGLPLSANEGLEKLKMLLLHKIHTDLASRDDNYLKDQLKILTRQFYNNLIGYKPVTEVHLYH